MRWGRSLFSDPRSERFTAINPLHFDNSVFDIYCGLLNGAALVPIETSESTNPAGWTKAIRRAQATVMFAVPTLFLILDSLGLLKPETLTTIRTFLFGGEGFPVERLKTFHGHFAGRARLVNVYGPTETSCICSSLDIDEMALNLSESKFPSLGRIHEDFEHLILDQEQRLVEPGGTGELWIGGPCVGLGYYRNPQETQACFRQNPLQDVYRSIWYRSGDLVREDADGLLWFRGRADNQVKIRGHRIELEEIDLAVQSVPGVRRAISVVANGGGDDQLHVVFVAERPIPAEEISEHCKRILPHYMQPHRVQQLDELPLNANGKVDRRAIRVLVESID
jgi:acyl-coenzyme A synthetase/AMP-(fatty) acid ligase